MSFIIALLRVVAVLLVIYLLLIMPRLANRPERRTHTEFMYAHRGLHDNTSDHPENSMAAFKRAVDAGYGIELDVQLTKDNVPVVFHDFTLERIARYDKGCVPEGVTPDENGEYPVKGSVDDYTYEELQSFHLLSSGERIPRFEDFLKLVEGRVPLVVEFKVRTSNISMSPMVCVLSWELLKDYKGIYCIESFHPFALVWFRRNHPEIFRGQLSEEFYRDNPGLFKSPVYFVLAMLMFNILTAPDFIAYNHKHAGNLSLVLCHRLYRLTAAAWTIKSEEELKEASKHFDMYIFDSFVPARGPRP